MKNDSGFETFLFSQTKAYVSIWKRIINSNHMVTYKEEIKYEKKNNEIIYTILNTKSSSSLSKKHDTNVASNAVIPFQRPNSKM